MLVCKGMVLYIREARRMAKDLVKMSMLYDLYGGMLTEKQRELFTLYYEEDLSLAEIAQNEGITRQGVRDTIVRAEEALLECEDRLRLSGRLAEIRRGAQKIAVAAYEVGEINRRSYFDTRVDAYVREIIEATRVME